MSSDLATLPTYLVLWLTPLESIAEKKRFSRGVLANTARFLRFASLETLRFHLLKA